jgi:CheY-like chemotaxis protein
MKTPNLILLVEDDAILGAMTVEILSECGHSSVLATSVADAFRLLAMPHRFVIVLLDLQLGSERGETLVERLRKANAIVPKIVILSAQSPAELDAIALSIGAAAVLPKPCSAQKITDVIEKLVA